MESLPVIGERVQLHPATDHWLRGDRYAEVVGFTRMGNLRLVLERSGKTACVAACNVLRLRDPIVRAAVLRGIKACDARCLDNEDERERVLASIMAELEGVGIRETSRP